MGRRKKEVEYSQEKELNSYGYMDYYFPEQYDYKVVFPKKEFWKIYEQNNSYNPYEDETFTEEENQRLAREEMSNKLKKAIKLLTPKQQIIVKLTLKGLTQKEIGEILGIDQSAVNLAWYGSYQVGYINRAGGIYRKLKKIIERQEDENNSQDNI